MTSNTASRVVIMPFLVLAVIVLAGAGCAPALTGKPAPNFRVEEPAGRVLTLDDFRGKTSVVLVFYHSYG